MATIYWKGGGVPVAQVTRATPANVGLHDVFSLTCNGHSVSYTSTAATVAAVTAGLATAWNASTIPEFVEITAASSTGGYATLTGDTAGYPFTVTGTATQATTGGSTTQTLTMSTTRVAAGPNHWDTAANWNGGVVPTTGDDVIIEHTDDEIKYGLDQSSVAINSLTIRQSFTGKIGLRRENQEASASANYYTEYRDRYLAIDGGTITIGEGSGDGSQRIQIDSSTGAASFYIYNSGTRLESGVEPIQIKGAASANTVSVSKGEVGIAKYAGETASVATLKVSYRGNQSGDATVRVGSGVTLSDVFQTGGKLELECGSSTLRIDYGTCVYRSTGTVVNTYVGGGGVLDFRHDPRPRTLTNCSVYGSAQIYDPARTVTFTNGIDLVRCGLEDVRLEIGKNFTITPSTI